MQFSLQTISITKTFGRICQFVTTCKSLSLYVSFFFFYAIALGEYSKEEKRNHYFSNLSIHFYDHVIAASPSENDILACHTYIYIFFPRFWRVLLWNSLGNGGFLRNVTCGKSHQKKKKTFYILYCIEKNKYRFLFSAYFMSSAPERFSQ